MPNLEYLLIRMPWPYMWYYLGQRGINDVKLVKGLTVNAHRGSTVPQRRLERPL